MGLWHELQSTASGAGVGAAAALPFDVPLGPAVGTAGKEGYPPMNEVVWPSLAPGSAGPSGTARRTVPTSSSEKSEASSGNGGGICWSASIQTEFHNKDRARQKKVAKLVWDRHTALHSQHSGLRHRIPWVRAKPKPTLRTSMGKDMSSQPTGAAECCTGHAGHVGLVIVSSFALSGGLGRSY